MAPFASSVFAAAKQLLSLPDPDLHPDTPSEYRYGVLSHHPQGLP